MFGTPFEKVTIGELRLKIEKKKQEQDTEVSRICNKNLINI